MYIFCFIDILEMILEGLERIVIDEFILIFLSFEDNLSFVGFLKFCFELFFDNEGIYFDFFIYFIIVGWGLVLLV